MDMLKLNIRSEPIQIDLNITQPVLDFKTTPPELSTHLEAAVVDIQTTPAQMDIDFTAYRYSLGLKDWTVFFKDNANDAKQLIAQGTSRRVQEGNTMGGIQNKNNAVGQIAFDALLSDGQVEINIDRLEMPEIQYTPGTIDINVRPGKFNIQYNPGKVDCDYHPGSVSPQVRRYPKMEMWTSVNKYDLYL